MATRGTTAVVAGTTARAIATLTTLARGTIEAACTIVTGATARAIAALTTLGALGTLSTCGNLGLIQAIQGDLATLIDIDNRDLNLIAHVKNVLDLLHAALGNAGDVQQAILAGQEVDECAERLDGNNATGVLRGCSRSGW